MLPACGGTVDQSSVLISVLDAVPCAGVVRPRLYRERPRKARRHTQAEPKIASLVNNRGSTPVRPRLTSRVLAALWRGSVQGRKLGALPFHDKKPPLGCSSIDAHMTTIHFPRWRLVFSRTQREATHTLHGVCEGSTWHQEASSSLNPVLWHAVADTCTGAPRS